jgi:hypothetical protein
MNNINGIISKTPSLNMPTPNVSFNTPKVSFGTPTMPSAGESWFTPRRFITLGLLIVILALLGMNIFGYFADGVDILGSIMQKFGLGTAAIAQQTIDVSMDGVKLGAGVAAGTVTDAANIVKGSVGGSTKTISAAVNANKKDVTPSKESNPTKEDQSSDSNIQTRGSNQKAGWCYVGTDRKVRSCIEVGKSNKCMSGNIFPSRDLCINPKLRG